jgi:hypothetical protein
VIFRSLTCVASAVVRTHRPTVGANRKGPVGCDRSRAVICSCRAALPCHCSARPCHRRADADVGSQSPEARCCSPAQNLHAVVAAVAAAANPPAWLPLGGCHNPAGTSFSSVIKHRS